MTTKVCLLIRSTIWLHHLLFTRCATNEIHMKWGKFDHKALGSCRIMRKRFQRVYTGTRFMTNPHQLNYLLIIHPVDPKLSLRLFQQYNRDAAESKRSELRVRVHLKKNVFINSSVQNSIHFL